MSELARILEALLFLSADAVSVADLAAAAGCDADEVAAALRELRGRQIVLDGELIALRDDGRPELFQVTAPRTATKSP